MQYSRLLLLLKELDTVSSNQLPRGVGMKTLIEARDHGIIELISDIRAASCILTPKGKELKEKVLCRQSIRNGLYTDLSLPTETVGGGD
jgi:hypothetical protein